MRFTTARLGRVLRNQLFADAIVVKSGSAQRAVDDPAVAAHVATAQRLSSALSRHRAARRRQTSVTPAAAKGAVFGESTATAPMLDIMASVGKSAMLVQQAPLSAPSWADEAEVGSRLDPSSSAWVRRSSSALPPATADHSTPETGTAASMDKVGTASCHHGAGVRQSAHEADNGACPSEVLPGTVTEALESVDTTWRASEPAARLHWILATPLGRRLAVAQLNATREVRTGSASEWGCEDDSEQEAVSAVEQMMRRYDGLGLRSRAICASSRPRPTSCRQLREGTASLDGLYPSRNSTGSSTRSHDYATLCELFACRLSPSSTAAADRDTTRPARGHRASLENPTFAGCAPPGPNTQFVSHKVSAAFSNQRKSLWKQQVKKMIAGEGATTFMGALKSLQQPSNEFTHTHTDQPQGLRTRAHAPRADGTAIHSRAELTSPTAPLCGSARRARGLSASAKAAGATPHADQAATATDGTSSHSGPPSPDYTRRFLRLCAEMGVGSPRYAYVSRALLSQAHPGQRGADDTNNDGGGLRTWNLEAVRAEAERLSREYDSHVSQLQEGRDPQQAAEARRHYDAALLEEQLQSIHTGLIDFRTQLPTLRRLADVLSN